MKNKLHKVLDFSAIKSHFIGEQTGKITKTGIVSVIFIIGTVISILVFSVIEIFAGFAKGISTSEKDLFI